MIRIRQIKIELDKDNDQELYNKIIDKTKLSRDNIISFKINKKSIDARKKDNIFYVYEVDVEIKNEDVFLRKNKKIDILEAPIEKYSFIPSGKDLMSHRPVIIGSGPSGLLCALLLAENGYKPLIIERGEAIEDRVKTVEEFWKTGKLNKNSNVQFGEGGAGTFSDGKLNTLVSDKYNRGRKVFETFVECGAPDEIMYLNKPHIGTDLLRNVIINLRNKIISLGGSFIYNTCLTDIIVNDKKIEKIVVNNEIIECDVLVLAIGHSSRDTFEMLLERGIEINSKPFAVGVRIQHPQELINKIQYGEKYASKMPAASYKLTYTTKSGRGVYSFCMCPGGYVVNASSEDNRLAVNGMSNHSRDSKNANSALVVSVNKDDFGEGKLAGLEFQRRLEEKAYNLGNGKIPVQLLKDYYNNEVSTSFRTVDPVFKGDYSFSDLNLLFSDSINNSLKEGIKYFDTKMKGYFLEDAIIAGVESRTSSPVVIPRNEIGCSNILGVFPCGEGCGYAGGITTAAMDGIKTAEYIMSIYKKFT